MKVSMRPEMNREMNQIMNIVMNLNIKKASCLTIHLNLQECVWIMIILKDHQQKRIHIVVKMLMLLIK